MELLIEPQQCNRCGHQWYPRRPIVPKVCPKCNSPYWNKPRKYKRREVQNGR